MESENKEVNSLLRSAFIDKSLQKSWNKESFSQVFTENVSDSGILDFNE
jgi:hypothetical protein